MKNLAGDKECDATILEELTQARIEILTAAEPADREVPARLSGKLGAFTFVRGWYYWIVEGPMPIALASEMWADPIGKKDVRSGGHCGCPDPRKYGERDGYVCSYHIDSIAGLRLFADTVRRIGAAS